MYWSFERHPDSRASYSWDPDARRILVVPRPRGGGSGLAMSRCTWISLKRFIRGHLERFFGSSRHSKMALVFSFLSFEFLGLMPQESKTVCYRSGFSGLDSCFLFVNAFLAVDPPYVYQ